VILVLPNHGIFSVSETKDLKHQIKILKEKMLKKETQEILKLFLNS